MTLEKTCVQFEINDARCPSLQLAGRSVCVNGKALSVLRLGWAQGLSCKKLFFWFFFEEG